MAEKNIWIYQDRIVYVGHELPNRAEEIHTIDCEGKYIVLKVILNRTHILFKYIIPKHWRNMCLNTEQRHS